MSRKAVESFTLSSDRLSIERTVHLRNGGSHASTICLKRPAPRRATSIAALASIADRAFLTTSSWPIAEGKGLAARTVELFSGCGAMALGVWEACRALGRTMEPVLALDLDETAMDVYKENFRVGEAMCRNVEDVLDSPLHKAPSRAEKKLIDVAGSVEILLGGPPCQGHSDLNNHSRRDDPKNRLYERMARAAEILRPEHVIIENVPSAVHDRGKVVQATRQHLESLGYSVDESVVEISNLGVAQRRKRHVMVASLTRKPDLQSSLVVSSAIPA